eukprot:g56097.t1
MSSHTISTLDRSPQQHALAAKTVSVLASLPVTGDHSVATSKTAKVYLHSYNMNGEPVFALFLDQSQRNITKSGPAGGQNISNPSAVQYVDSSNSSQHHLFQLQLLQKGQEGAAREAMPARESDATEATVVSSGYRSSVPTAHATDCESPVAHRSAGLASHSPPGHTRVATVATPMQFVGEHIPKHMMMRMNDAGQHHGGAPKRKERFRTSEMNDIQDSAIHCQVVIREGKYKGEIGIVKRSGHGFYGVELSGRGEIMKRGAELALLDGTTLGKEKRKRGLFSDKDKNAHMAPGANDAPASQSKKRLKPQLPRHSKHSLEEVPKRRRTSSTHSHGVPTLEPQHSQSRSRSPSPPPLSPDRSEWDEGQGTGDWNEEDEVDDFQAYHRRTAYESDEQHGYETQYTVVDVVEDEADEAELSAERQAEEADLRREEQEVEKVLPWARTSELKRDMAKAFARKHRASAARKAQPQVEKSAKLQDEAEAASMLLALKAF